MASDTPRTDALINDDTDWMERDTGCVGELLKHARQLERELCSGPNGQPPSEDFIMGRLDKDISDALHGLPAIWRPGFRDRWALLLRKAIRLCSATGDRS